MIQTTSGSHPNSPFTPGYGRRPLVYGGHENLLEDMRTVFAEHDLGESQSLLLSGLRGAGKTSMLQRLQDLARENDWLVISEDASAGLHKRLTASIVPGIVNDLPQATKVELSSLGLWHFSAEWQVDRRPVRTLLRQDLATIAEHSGARGILLTIDEVSSGKTRLREVSAVAREVSHAMAQGVEIVIAFAGIKVDLDELLRQDHTTFLRRSRAVEFTRLSPPEARQVLDETAKIGGRTFDEDALRHLIAVSQGYPFLVQLLGHYAWTHDLESPTIDLKAAEEAQRRGVKAVMDRVMSKVFADLSEKDQEFLRAMAVDEDRSRIGDIVDRLDSYSQYVNGYRNRLIDSGYVEADGHGYIRFALPYLGAYIRSMAEPSAAEHADAWADFPPPSL
ncbi:ATP-binding protein [Micrococcus lylae]|uniref:ATP-binding protein n=1 Tax=Micrococcus lylae TaxID=1273 RepID=UPI003EBF4564